MEIEAYCPVVRGKMDDPVIVAIASKVHRSASFPVWSRHSRVSFAPVQHNKEPAQALLRWSLQQGYVRRMPFMPHAHGSHRFHRSFIPLPRSSNPARIKANTELYNFELSDDDMARLNALDKGAEGAVSWNPVDRADVEQPTV